MTSFKLWVDESGNFSQKDYTSLVGGILYEDKDNEKTQNIIDEWIKIIKQFSMENNLNEDSLKHANQLNDSQLGKFALFSLPKLEKFGVHYVLFENEENVLIGDEDTTYIHILSEGVIQLIQYLSLENKDVNLEINIARRMGNNGKIEIHDREYKTRFEEKIDLGSARRNIQKNSLKWSFNIYSARKEVLLYISDLVCHLCYSIRKGTKLNNEEKIRIENLIIEDNYYYTALENFTIASIQKDISRGHFSEALYDLIIILSNDFDVSTKLTKSELEKLNSMILIILKLIQKQPDYSQDSHFINLINKLKVFANNYRFSEDKKQRINIVLEDILNKMNEINFIHTIFFYNIHLYIFSDATHRGDISAANKQILSLNKLVSVLSNQWDNLDLVLDFYIRESVHKNNIFQYEEVIQSTQKLEEFIRDFIQLFSESFSDDFSNSEYFKNSDKLGKIIGTRIQSRILLSRENIDQLSVARNESNKAIEQFTAISDLNRQYQYRSQIEYEDKKYKEAIYWLAKSVGVNNNADYTVLLNGILNQEKINSTFGLLHYSNIFSKATQSENVNDKQLSVEMFNAWIKESINEKMIEKELNSHPIELIIRNIALFHFNNNNHKAAIKNYEYAFNLSSSKEHELTKNAIRLSILAQGVGLTYINNKKKTSKILTKNKLINEYNDFMKKEMPNSMNSFFEKWNSIINNTNLTDSEYAKNLIEFADIIGY